ncbi:1,4-alpha-glucan branching protein GlgB [Ferrimonas aestuarii]|uniref:1,4-alpha-glucan branching enzyme GlgB n=1 Tax=Ferrimonas aestuarii TaxID=2569539 RepID=A0A4U1BVD3_9GAMM|nr:1,4-alpha-glucan branching protein GlgB [Ferrimonas aestuarii]TKB58561.1 1,4-alpha-glucan branching protein GlgB [Ferrimonas aestuarii]
MTLTCSPDIDHAPRLELNQRGMKPSQGKRGLTIGCYFPGAVRVEVLHLQSGKTVCELPKLNDAGEFFGAVGRRFKPFRYQFRVRYPEQSIEVIDPYQFAPELDSEQQFMFAEGTLEQAYHYLGANWHCQDGIEGVRFALWAPNAKRVNLIGDFNHWDDDAHPMLHCGDSGIWQLFIPRLTANQHYQFHILGDDNLWRKKADPYAKVMALPPFNAGRVPAKPPYQWQDQKWLRQRGEGNSWQEPLSIYELHAGSWKRDEHNRHLNFDQLADSLIPYVKQMGFTHIQLMPIMAHPFTGSWGYQPIGLYSLDPRLGTQDQLKGFIDRCHQQGIGVLLDWVIAHFPKDSYGLERFDGTALYEHHDPSKAHHPDWDTALFNYGRNEVRSYLLSNAFYWLKEFHFDGLRLDAVSSMLYLDYSRGPDEWQPNIDGGNEHLEAVSLLKTLNQRCHFNFPGVLMVAEESTSWSGVSHGIEQGGLGFGYKWNMGWMNDCLRYLNQDPLYRCHHHGLMNFAMVYAYSENFILAISHDEVVHGKGAMLSKIPGDPWQQFATLRAFYGFMWAHPGKKLLFMGQEFGQWQEWHHDGQLDWPLLGFDTHQGVQRFVSELNALYKATPALYELDHSDEGFRWLDCDDAERSLFSFVRYDSQGNAVVAIINMTPQVHTDFRLGVPQAGLYTTLINSDHRRFGGSGVTSDVPHPSEAIEAHQQPHSIRITVPPLGCVYLARESAL